MRPFLAITLLTFVTGQFAIASTPTSGDEQEVTKLQGSFYEAYSRGDSAAIDRMLADDYTHNDLRGGFKDRAAYMAYINSVAAAIKSGSVKIDRSSIDDLRVRIYGNMAVATGRWTAQGAKGGDQTTEQLRFTYVWVKRANHWQAVAGQVTPVTSK